MQKQCQYHFFMNFTVWVLEIANALIRWKKHSRISKKKNRWEKNREEENSRKKLSIISKVSVFRKKKTITSIKTNPCCGSNNQKRSNGKKNNINDIVIYWILSVKQQHNIEKIFQWKLFSFENFQKQLSIRAFYIKYSEKNRLLLSHLLY